MRWILKALTKKLMSAIPLGTELDYLCQLKVTKSLPLNDAEFLRRVSMAAKHWDAFKRFSSTKIPSKLHFFEFGAGWDLIIPITYYTLGVRSQTVVDIRDNIRLELVNDSICKFIRHRKEVSRILNRKVNLEAVTITSSEGLLYRFGITYLAPYLPGDRLLPSNSFDFISNSATMEHIPVFDLYDMLNECHRLLKPEGIISCHIDLRDHYSYFDGRISHYNFLKFSDLAWRLVNSSLHFQNRLRSSDYEKIVKKVGFVILDKKEAIPGEHDINILQKMKISKTFKSGQNLQKLGIKDLRLSLRRSTSHSHDGENKER